MTAIVSKIAQLPRYVLESQTHSATYRFASVLRTQKCCNSENNDDLSRTMANGLELHFVLFSRKSNAITFYKFDFGVL